MDATERPWADSRMATLHPFPPALASFRVEATRALEAHKPALETKLAALEKRIGAAREAEAGKSCVTTYQELWQELR